MPLGTYVIPVPL